LQEIRHVKASAPEKVFTSVLGPADVLVSPLPAILGCHDFGVRNRALSPFLLALRQEAHFRWMDPPTGSGLRRCQDFPDSRLIITLGWRARNFGNMISPFSPAKFQCSSPALTPDERYRHYRVTGSGGPRFSSNADQQGCENPPPPHFSPALWLTFTTAV
jgi:hypothetical protein